MWPLDSCSDLPDSDVLALILAYIFCDPSSAKPEAGNWVYTGSPNHAGNITCEISRGPCGCDRTAPGLGTGRPPCARPVGAPGLRRASPPGARLLATGARRAHFAADGSGARGVPANRRSPANSLRESHTL